MPASSAAHSRKTRRMLQQKNLIFCLFAHILFAFGIFAVFLAILSSKHQQQLLTIIHYYLISKGSKKLNFFKFVIFHSVSLCYPLFYRLFFHHSLSLFMPISKKTHKKLKKTYAYPLSLAMMLANFMDTGV